MRTSSSVVALTPLVYMSVAAARTIRSRVAKPRLVKRRACVSSSSALDMAATLGQEIREASSLDPSVRLLPSYAGRLRERRVDSPRPALAHMCWPSPICRSRPLQRGGEGPALDRMVLDSGASVAQRCAALPAAPADHSGIDRRRQKWT